MKWIFLFVFITSVLCYCHSDETNEAIEITSEAEAMEYLEELFEQSFNYSHQIAMKNGVEFLYLQDSDISEVEQLLRNRMIDKNISRTILENDRFVDKFNKRVNEKLMARHELTKILKLPCTDDFNAAVAGAGIGFFICMASSGNILACSAVYGAAVFIADLARDNCVNNY